MRPIRFLTIKCWLTFVCFLLAFFACCPTFQVRVAWADAAAEEQADQTENSPEEKAPPPKQAIVLKKKAPLHELPVLKPKQLGVPARLLVPEAVAKTRVEKKPAKKKVIQPAFRQPNAPFWFPRRATLSPAAIFRLESMGRNAQLSPAMQFHLNRSGASINAPPEAQSSAAAATTVSGQRTPRFYPGVSRLPTQKPFANLERPPTAIERYWPLLLEGRQDPETGLIIWQLP